MSSKVCVCIEEKKNIKSLTKIYVAGEQISLINNFSKEYKVREVELINFREWMQLNEKHEEHTKEQSMICPIIHDGSEQDMCKTIYKGASSLSNIVIHMKGGNHNLGESLAQFWKKGYDEYKNKLKELTKASVTKTHREVSIVRKTLNNIAENNRNNITKAVIPHLSTNTIEKLNVTSASLDELYTSKIVRESVSTDLAKWAIKTAKQITKRNLFKIAFLIIFVKSFNWGSFSQSYNHDLFKGLNPPKFVLEEQRSKEISGKKPQIPRLPQPNLSETSRINSNTNSTNSSNSSLQPTSLFSSPLTELPVTPTLLSTQPNMTLENSPCGPLSKNAQSSVSPFSNNSDFSCSFDSPIRSSPLSPSVSNNLSQRSLVSSPMSLHPSPIPISQSPQLSNNVSQGSLTSSQELTDSSNVVVTQTTTNTPPNNAPQPKFTQISSSVKSLYSTNGINVDNFRAPSPKNPNRVEITKPYDPYKYLNKGGYKSYSPESYKNGNITIFNNKCTYKIQDDVPQLKVTNQNLLYYLLIYAETNEQNPDHRFQTFFSHILSTEEQNKLFSEKQKKKIEKSKECLKISPEKLFSLYLQVLPLQIVMNEIINTKSIEENIVDPNICKTIVKEFFKNKFDDSFSSQEQKELTDVCADQFDHKSKILFLSIQILRHKGVLLENNSIKQQEFIKNHINSPYRLMLDLYVIEESNKSSFQNKDFVFPDPWFGKKKKNEHKDKIEDRVARKMKLILKHEFSFYKFESSGDKNIIGNKLSGSIKKKNPTIKVMSSSCAIKKIKSETWNKLVESEGIKKISDPNGDIYIHDFRKVFTNELQDCLNKGLILFSSLETMINSHFMYATVYLDGARFGSRTGLQATMSFCPLSNNEALRFIQSKYLIKQLRIGWTFRKEDREGTKTFCSVIKTNLDELQKEPIKLITKNQEEVEVVLKYAGAKADVKMVHMIAGTEGVKSDCPCALCKTPRKFWVNLRGTEATFCYPDRKNQAHFCDIAEREDAVEWSLFGELYKPLLGDSIQIIFDTLHNCSNHGYDVIDCIFRFIRKKELKVHISDEIKKISKQHDLELPTNIPTKADHVRKVLASISTVLEDPAKREKYFPKRPFLAGRLHMACKTLSSFYKSIYITVIPCDSSRIRSLVLCYLHVSYLDDIIVKYPKFITVHEKDNQLMRRRPDPSSQPRQHNPRSSQKAVNYEESEESDDGKESDDGEEFFEKQTPSQNTSTKRSKTKKNTNTSKKRKTSTEKTSQSPDTAQNEIQENTQIDQNVPTNDGNDDEDDSKATPASIFSFSYFHIFIRHLLFLLRKYSNYELLCEKEEGSWVALKKYMRWIAQEYAYRIACIKESIQKDITSKFEKMLDLDYNLKFDFFKDFGEELTIPLEFIYENRQTFNKYFVFFSKFVLDVPSSRVSFDKNGLTFNCSKLDEGDKMVFIAPEYSEEVTIKSIHEKFLENLKESMVVSSSMEFFCHLIETQDYGQLFTGDFWWFKYDEYIDCVNTLKKLKGYYNLAKNKRLKIEEIKTFPKKDQDLSAFKQIIKKIYSDNHKEIDECFPDPK